MAGNLVKWWRHKILGGYKHFSGFNECPTDTEELIYPMRAPSSCSAPPDLLLSSGERELQTSRCPTPVQIRETDDKSILAKKIEQTFLSKEDQDRIHLEEFTCDVSVEGGGKTPQPLQFSFTLYDLDGHGKITKDDIAGIVSTIYESIGKTVVVPHYGSKTINVRLTVSPDGKKIKPQKKAIVTPRRRVRPRKLTTDDDGSDTSNDVYRPNIRINNLEKTEGGGKCHFHGDKLNRISKDCSTTTTTTDSAVTDNFLNKTIKNDVTPTSKLMNDNHNVYDRIHNLKFCGPVVGVKLGVCTPMENTLVVNNLQIKEENEPCHDCTLEVAAHKHNLRKKLLRKSRSRKQAKESHVEEAPVSRMRSLSVGNENCYNQAEGAEECWKSSLRRHELIEIIRESMEKNRLCFQSNRKPTLDNSPVSVNHRHRHRSHTISKMIDNLNDSSTITPHSVLPETNLCGYDSFLHATICSNANNNIQHATTVPLHASPVANVTPHRLNAGHHHHHTKKTPKTKNHQVPPTTNPANRSTKLNTSLVNQLNPNLSAEQKLSRTINHVEKWLTDRDHQAPIGTVNTPANNKNDKNNASYRLKGASGTKLTRSKSKEEIPLKEKSALKIVEDIEKSAKKCKQNALPNSAKTTPEHVSSKTKQGLIMEYATIPVNADPSECENLLRGSDEDTNNTTSATPSTVHRYVHEHIHHHYHHFENDEA